MSNLPTELLENIFLHLDGKSLAKAQQVCRSWYQIIYQLQNIKNIWKLCCLKEIPSTVIEEFIGNKYSLSCEKVQKQNYINWNTVYQKWYCGLSIKNCPYWKKQFVVFDANPISCIKGSGDIIITGHRNGSICAWNTYTGELLRVIAQHLGIVTDIVVVNLLNKECYGVEKLRCYHHHIISVSTDHTIQLSSIIANNHKINKSETLRYHSSSLESIKLFGNIFIVNSMDNTLSVWELIPPITAEDSLKVTFKTSIHGPVDILNWIGFWKDKIYCICRNGKLEIFSLQKNDWISSQPAIFYTAEKPILNLIITIVNASLYRDSIIFLHASDATIGVSVGNSEYYCWRPMRKLHSQIICTALRGNILVLGSEKGTVYLYNVTSPEDLKHLELAQPTWHCNLSEASIIAIDITFDNCFPCVIAATTEKIFYIQWFHQKIYTEKLIEGIINL